MTLTPNWLAKFAWPPTLLSGHPLAIAHRGASDYGPENSLKAFQIAADLCAEMWELDVHLSADGVCVVSHDDNLKRVSGQDISIRNSSWAEISAINLPENQHISRLEEIIDLAKATGCGLYIEIKGEGAGLVAWRILSEAEFSFACLGSFVVEWVAELAELGCTYPLSVLVPKNKDPIKYLNGLDVDIIHLCWRDASDKPHELLTEDLMARLSNYQVVIWDEDRTEILDGLWRTPVMGICSNRPEMLKPYKQALDNPIDIVCHRGANWLAPENTVEAAKICMAQKFQYVELDVRTTADGALAVIHDASLERTTNGKGPVDQQTLEQIQNLDAGRWFRNDGAKHVIPSLAEFCELTKDRAGLYVEIKQADARAVLEIVNTHAMLDKCFFWSADIGTLIDLRRLSDDIQLMVPRWVFSSLKTAIGAYGAQIVEFDAEKDDLSEIAQCKDLGVRSMIYSRQSDWDELASYLQFEPDMVNLDFPDRFKIVKAYPRVRSHFENMVQNAYSKKSNLSPTKRHAIIS